MPTLTNNPPTDMAKAAPGGLDTATELAGRILLAALFMLSGVGKITAYEAAFPALRYLSFVQWERASHGTRRVRILQRTACWPGATAEGVSERAEISADQCAHLHHWQNLSRVASDGHTSFSGKSPLTSL